MAQKSGDAEAVASESDSWLLFLFDRFARQVFGLNIFGFFFHIFYALDMKESFDRSHLVFKFLRKMKVFWASLIKNELNLLS